MSEAAPGWDALAASRPRLRPEIETARHLYRGEPWQVLHDPLSGRTHRMPERAFAVAALLDGRRTLADAQAQARDSLGDAAPGRAESAELLARLSASGLLCDEQSPGRAPHGLARALANPFAVRIPLLDPDRLLRAMVPLARPLFSGAGALAWLVLVTAGLAVALTSWPALAAHWNAQSLAPGTVALIAVAYVAMKLLHELGHGLATRVWGGAVHEVGIQLLVLFPLPYVDASSSSVFPERRRRIVVAAAGIAVELALAAAALLLWSQSEPGPLRDLMLNVAVIGGISTLAFNGNPLLRFDGYHVLAELVEIPGLATRSGRYWRHLAERHLFAVPASRSPASAPGETPWLAGYGLLAGLYRWVVAIGIVWFVAGIHPTLGTALAAWAAAVLLGAPLLRLTRYLRSSPAIAGRRARAIAATAAAAGVLAIVLVAVPVPFASRAEGVVWPPDDAYVRAEGAGIVTEVLVAAGQRVRRGEVLLRLDAPLLDAEIDVLEARRAELEAELAVEAFDDRLRAATLRDAIAAVAAEAALARERLARMEVIAPADGVFVPLDARNPLGSYLRQGDRVGLVSEGGPTRVRAAVDERVAGLIRDHGAVVTARFADAIGTVVRAELAGQTPAAGHELPSRVLGTAGGGVVPVDRSDGTGLRTLSPVFEILLEIRDPPGRPVLGQRVHLRFDHGTAALAHQWWRAVRQTFLRRLGF